MKYVDPTGHFFSGVRSWVRNHRREIAGVVTFGAASLAFTSNGVKNYIATHRWAQMVGGMVAGAYGGPWGAAAWSSYTTYTQGGSLSQIAGAGLTSYVTAGLADGIGGAYGHESSFFTIGNTYNGVTVTAGMATKKAIMHGLVRGMVQAGQGGKFESGFASGFVSSGFSVGNRGYGNVYSRTAIMAVVGGTTSVITGGKFANGAESGAFVHLYNAEGMTLSKGISYVANSVQLVAGGFLSWTGVGAVLGVPMMAHASNNLYETYYDTKDSLLRNFETDIGLNYDYMDVGISTVSGVTGAAKQVGMKGIQFMGNNAIRGYVPIRDISTMTGKANAALTTSGILNTANAMNHE